MLVMYNIIMYLSIPSQALPCPSNGIIAVIYVRFQGLISANSCSQMENSMEDVCTLLNLSFYVEYNDVRTHQQNTVSILINVQLKIITDLGWCIILARKLMSC